MLVYQRVLVEHGHFAPGEIHGPNELGPMKFNSNGPNGATWDDPS